MGDTTKEKTMTIYRLLNGVLLTALFSTAALAESATVDTAGVEENEAKERIVAEQDEVSDSTANSATAEKEQITASSRSRKDVVVVKENLDTVFIFDKSVFRHVARDWRNNIDIFRQRGYGLSGSSYYGAHAVYIRPVEELAENLPALSGKKFHFGTFGFEPFLMSGGGGYVGLGDGFRLGGVGMSGERKFSSSRFGGDSILVLNTKVSYGGFLIEKCMVRDKWNFSAGGLLGAGNIKVAITEQANTFFFGEDDFPDDDDQQYNHRATCFMIEPHGSVTYSFFYFFHFGARISLPTFMSLDKFGIYTNDFFSINPGMHITLTFGNLG